MYGSVLMPQIFYIFQFLHFEAWIIHFKLSIIHFELWIMHFNLWFFQRLWRSIGTLFNESGLRKKLRGKSGTQSFYQHSISPEFSLPCSRKRGLNSKNLPLRLNTLWTRKGYCSWSWKNRIHVACSLLSIICKLPTTLLFLNPIWPK